MSKNLFGRTISIEFNPVAGDEPQSFYAIASARLYDTLPSLEQMQNTAGGEIQIGSIGEQTEDGFTVTFPPVANPDPLGYDIRPYWAVVNGTLEAAGAETYILEQIFLYRPDSLTSRVNVTAEDVFAEEGKFRALKPASWVEKKILAASQDIDTQLAAEGLNRSQTFNREKLDRAVTLLAAAYGCRDLAGEGNPAWWQKYQDYKDSSAQALKVAQLGYDISGTGSPAADETRFTGAVRIMR